MSIAIEIFASYSYHGNVVIPAVAVARIAAVVAVVHTVVAVRTVVVAHAAVVVAHAAVVAHIAAADIAAADTAPAVVDCRCYSAVPAVDTPAGTVDVEVPFRVVDDTVEVSSRVAVAGTVVVAAVDEVAVAVDDAADDHDYDEQLMMHRVLHL